MQIFSWISLVLEDEKKASSIIVIKFVFVIFFWEFCFINLIRHTVREIKNKFIGMFAFLFLVLILAFLHIEADLKEFEQTADFRFLLCRVFRLPHLKPESCAQSLVLHVLVCQVNVSGLKFNVSWFKLM